MSLLVDLSAARMAWEGFIERYMVVERNDAEALRRTPPPFITRLDQRLREAMPARPGR